MAKAKRGRNEGALFEDKSRKRWVAFVTAAGKRYYAYAQTKDAARLKLLDLQAKHRAGTLGKTDNAGTVKEAVLSWFESRPMRSSSARRYKSIIDRRIIPALGAVSLTGLTADMLEAFYKKDAGKSAASAVKAHNILYASLQRALKRGLVAHNVCAIVERPRPKKTQAEAFTKEELVTLFEATRGGRDFPLYFCAARLGMRQGELLALQWDDVDLKAGRLAVKHTLLNDNGKMSLGEPKTPKSRRAIALSPQVVEVLRSHQARLLAEGLRAISWVFPNTKGGPQQRNHVWARFQKRLIDAGLKAKAFHAQRHTAASMMLGADVHPKVVQELLGHASIATTLDTYSHLVPGMQEQAAKKMDAIFNKVSSKVS